MSLSINLKKKSIVPKITVIFISKSFHIPKISVVLKDFPDNGILMKAVSSHICKRTKNCLCETFGTKFLIITPFQYEIFPKGMLKGR